MVKKVTNRKSLHDELFKEVDSLLNYEVSQVIKFLEGKGYIDIDQPKFNIIVPAALMSMSYDKDILSKKLGFVCYSDSKQDKEEYQFTQEEIDKNPVLKKLEAFKVEVK